MSELSFVVVEKRHSIYVLVRSLLLAARNRKKNYPRVVEEFKCFEQYYTNNLEQSKQFNPFAGEGLVW